MPWWLLGISMVATTFSTDTPNLVTDIVRTGGVAGNWVWWAFLLTGMLTTFVYARLWRRSGVDSPTSSFYELRYSGKPARFPARLPGDLPRRLLQRDDHGLGDARGDQDRRRDARRLAGRPRSIVAGGDHRRLLDDRRAHRRPGHRLRAVRDRHDRLGRWRRSGRVDRPEVGGLAKLLEHPEVAKRLSLRARLLESRRRAGRSS